MATTLSGTIILSIQAAYANNLDFRSVMDNMALAYSLSFDDPPGANQATKIACDQRVLATAASETLDCSGGAQIVPSFATTLTLTKLKGLLVYASALNTTAIQVTRPLTTGIPIFLPTAQVSYTVESGVELAPGNILAMTNLSDAGWPVAAGVDLIKVTNAAGGTATYDIWLVGI
jgi:hypothetical protein